MSHEEPNTSTWSPPGPTPVTLLPINRGSVNIEKLKGPQNFATWKFQMKTIIASRRLGDVVYSQGNQALITYSTRDAEAQELLGCTLEGSVVQKVVNCNTANEIWTRLMSVFERKGEGNIEELFNNFCNMQMLAGEDMGSYIGRMEQIVSELRNQNQEITDLMHRARLVGGLSSKYHGFNRAWNATIESSKNVQHLMERLFQDEAEINRRERSRKPDSNVALLAGQSSNARQRRRNRLSPEELKALKARTNCKLCGIKGHWAEECKSKEHAKQESENKFSGGISLMMNREPLDKKRWYADSGASAHMTPEISNFTEYQTIKSDRQVLIGDNSGMKVEGIGKVRCISRMGDQVKQLDLLEVLHVPGLAANLLSVSSAMRNGAEISFKNEVCRINVKDETVATGKLACGGMFQLSIETAGDSAMMIQESRTIEEWHRALGHIGHQQVLRMAEKHSVTGLSIKKATECADCPPGKAIHCSHPSSSRIKAEQPGDVVHVDLVGPISPPSIGGSRFILLLTDEHSNYRVSFPLKSKEETFDRLQKYIGAIENETGKRLKHLWSDQGSEFINTKVSALLNYEHVSLITSTAYTPQQNGAAERSNRTMIEMARTMLQASRLGLELWSEAVGSTCYILNRTTQSSGDARTPFEKWFGRVPCISHIHEFGRQVQVMDSARKESKWSSKTLNANLVGYTHRRNTYRVYLPKSREVKISCDVIFRTHSNTAISEENNGNSTIASIDTFHIGEDRAEKDQGSDFSREGNDETEPLESGQVEETYQQSNKEPSTDIDLPTGWEESNNVNMTRGSAMDELDDLFAFTIHGEPTNYNEALSCSDSDMWRQAIIREVKSLESNKTWSIAEIPEQREPLTARWLFKRKLLPNGQVDKFKARLVARGFKQRDGIDYGETFAPVARVESIRTVLAIAEHYEMNIVQFDVETAFLHGVLQEEVYLCPPDGINCPKGKVLKLNRSIYGLKQAPRCWKEKFDSILRANKLFPTTSDPCVYIGKFEGEDVILLIYVDDGLMVAKSMKILDRMLDDIGKLVKVHKVQSNFFIGFEIGRTKNGDMSLHQSAYIKKMLEDYKMCECSPVTTPLNDACALMRINDDDKPTSAPYRQLIGSLLYCACLTRPDILFSVNLLARHNERPQERHWTAAKRVLRYLKGTNNLSIVFKQTENIEVQCYSDADWGSDCMNRRSTSGVVICLSGSPVIFRSKQQSLVALSSTESEYIAASLAVRELTWLQQFLGELKVKIKSSTVFIDNQATIKLVKNPEHHQRTKHIEIRQHHIREKFKSGAFSLQFVPSSEQKADVLTKCLQPKVHIKMVHKLGLIMVLMCAIHCSNASFFPEDPIVWRPTHIKHIQGQMDLSLDLMFYDPCPLLFGNLTNIPKVDRAIVKVCSKRFKLSITDELEKLCPTSHVEARGAVAAAGITAISAILSAAFIETRAMPRIGAIETLIIDMDEQIKRIRDSVIISNGRLSQKIASLEKDVDFISTLLHSQPEINDSLTQILMRFNEVRTKLLKLKPLLKISKEVPYTLLELFNITHLATVYTLQHSTIHKCRIVGQNKVAVHVSLMTMSEHVDILKADAFSYWSVEENKYCHFMYKGPEYMLFNSTTSCIRPLISGEVQDDILLSEGCIPQKEKRDQIKLYDREQCIKITSENPYVPRAQIKHFGQSIRVNCQGRFIAIEGKKEQCPNYIFSIPEDRSFTIDEYHYRHEATNISRPQVDYSIPTSINLQLGTDRTEFQSLTAAEVETLKNVSNAALRHTLTGQWIESDSPILNFFSSTLGSIRDACLTIGSYFSFPIALLLIFVIGRSTWRRRSAPAVVAILMLIRIAVFVGAAQTQFLELKPTAEEATAEIISHQKYILDNWCRKFRFEDSPDLFYGIHGYYPETLSCLLAKLKYTCPCDASPEYVPLNRRGRRDELEKVNVNACDRPYILTTLQVDMIDKLDIMADNLCFYSHTDHWPRETTGRLISSGCLLARKMFNCACSKNSMHKQIIWDGLTKDFSNQIHSSSNKDTVVCDMSRLPLVITNRSTVYETFYAEQRKSTLDAHL